MSELEPNKSKRPNKPKQTHKQQQLQKYKRPFPKFSPEDQKKSPELVSYAFKWLLEEHEQQWFEIKENKRTIAKQSRVIRRKDGVISAISEEKKIQAVVFDKEIKRYKERERSQFGSTLVSTVLIILGGALTSVGASFVPTPANAVFGAVLVGIGVLVALVGVACLLFMRPRGDNK